MKALAMRIQGDLTDPLNVPMADPSWQLYDEKQVEEKENMCQLTSQPIIFFC